MSNPTSNFNWQMPTNTDLVSQLPADFEVFGQAVDTSLADLKGGTTGQVLSKASNTDMDFTWVAQDDSNAIQNAIVDAKGDLITATGADTPARLAVGSNGQILTADSTTATGLKWSAAGASFVGARAYPTAVQNASNGTDTYIALTSEDFDTDGFHSNSTNNSRFTIPTGKAGYYLVMGQILWQANSTGQRNVGITKNRTTTLCNTANLASSGSGGARFDCNGISYLAEGDYIELVAYQDSGTTLEVQGYSNQYVFMAIQYLGA